MKKAFSVILSAALLLSYSTAVISASAEENGVVYEKKEVETYSAIGRSEIVDYTCLVRSDLPEVPFVNAQDYLSQLFKLEDKPNSLGNGVYKFENGDYSMTVDANNDTV